MVSQVQQQFQIFDYVLVDLVYNIGFVEGLEFLVDLYIFMVQLYDWLLLIFYSVGLIGGVWYLFKYVDVFFVLCNFDYFIIVGVIFFLCDLNDLFQFILFEIDLLYYCKYCVIFDLIFLFVVILKMEVGICDFVNGLIDEVVDKGGCEFIIVYGWLLLVLIFFDIMGLLQLMCDMFVDWVVGLLYLIDCVDMVCVFQLIVVYFKEVIVEKMKNFDDKVISCIVQVVLDGQLLSGQEVFGFVVFLFIVGFDIVFVMMNNIWLWFVENFFCCYEIIVWFGDMNVIIEELLCKYVVIFLGCMLCQDLELCGVQMKVGDKVISILLVCNYDFEVFFNLIVVDFDCLCKLILLFVGGVYSCMGVYLVWLEICIGLEEWLKCIFDFLVKFGIEIEYCFGGVVGFEYLLLVWQVVLFYVFFECCSGLERINGSYVVCLCQLGGF